MPWWTWAALAFFVAVVAGGTTITLLAFFRIKRLRATGDHLAAALDDITRRTEELELRLEHAHGRAELVQRKVAQLNASMERLSVLTWALGDVARTISHVRRSVLLRK